MKIISRLLVVGALALLPGAAHAGLGVPYTNDSATLHLWHFDDAAINNLSGVNTNILTADAAASNPIILTNLGNPNPGTPPYTDTILGAPGAAGLGTAMSSASKNAFSCGAIQLDATTFFNTNTGAFTFEALVLFSNNPVGPLPNNMEVFCGDQPSGSLAARGWQFRINNGKQMEFNLLGGNSSDNDWKANLPTSGPDQAQANQWYHMAVTFTGNTPTNSDIPSQLTFYWTLLDGSRTAADPLATFTMSRELDGSATNGPGTVQPGVGIGGSGRKVTAGANGVANGEGLIGEIDEVRISNIARASNAMAFVPGGTFPATFTSQPPSNNLVGFGQTLSLSPLVSGTSVSAQWQATNLSGGGFTNIPNQTNTSFVISNVTFSASGAYRLIISNVLVVKTSVVAQVTIGASVSELYDTGVNTGGVLDQTLAGQADPHYFLVSSADLSSFGPPAIVWNMSAYPIASFNGNFANADNDSAWVGPHNDSYTSPAGQYTYRTYFLLDSVDLTKPLTIQGIWFENEIGTNILVNGVPSGNSLSSASSSDGKFSSPFTLTSGFVPGLNTMDFVTIRPTTPLNTVYQESAVRVEFLSAVGQALPSGLPSILQNPAPVTVSDASTGVSATATFSVVATGRPPLSYQWLDQNHNPIASATNRTLTYLAPSAGNQPTSFSCVISNASGAVTSTAGSLTLVNTNIPPVLANASFVIYTNQVLTINLDPLFNQAYDQNGFPLIYALNDSTGTNGFSSIVQTGATLVYTPGTDVIGQDSFTYALEAEDPFLTPGYGTIFITTVVASQPSISSLALAGSSLALRGSNGTPGGPFNVLSTTSITNDLTNWTILTLGNFDGSGNLNVSLPVSHGTPAQFFIIQLP